MDRYCEIKRRLLDIARQDGRLSAIIAIGSTVRDYSAADEYSDLDLIIACENTEDWLFGDMPDRLGDARISFVEPTLGGGKERRLLFDGSLDLDLIVFTPQQLRQAVDSGAAAAVMNRGYAVLYDSMGISSALEAAIQPGHSRAPMSEQEFLNVVNDFWFHTVWSAKKILRGELWTAKMCIDAYIKEHLLRVTELRQAAKEKRDVWHNGRFFEKWAGEDTLAAAAGCFAHYERGDMISALLATARLFSVNARDAAAHLDYRYPDGAESYACSLLEEYFPRERVRD